ncbi:TPA: GNAT family N-acetyltransferase [Streptococcus equi subsp. zooepidemicus]|nr:GNAT family N-acetyltransferase [Streptococcus equi subsp. zooepidemicus]HEL0039250.1 GNAT family N-acetyltransferase [Streptococcus equi subsp. zooepidemicus]HEL0041200.1 GNAT family N-acetyltransferase [Streptococcus equi subsp. zooepidemicus]HEL0043254.1 GNAT family N-acetyltransferase [Streptococcus equi subsp. zooepidemicus]HEL0051245.1 GNAT family N-acetyltransferase [Streptococcus equi subsp. zooepidemicus]
MLSLLVGGLMAVKLLTERLIIQELNETYFEAYHKAFTEEITAFQWPDPFKDIASANETLASFIAEMKKGNMLELVILNKANDFVGSLEVFSLDSETPELGIWLKKSSQGLGYGYEALRAIVDYLKGKNKYRYFNYEVDVRNTGSIKLVEKFNVVTSTYQECETASKKRLCLQVYHILN